MSYHHRADQAYYEALSRHVSEDYDVLYDNSPDRAKDSDDAEYIMRSLRENHIFRTSCTIVLCGQETRWRKVVDCGRSTSRCRCSTALLQCIYRRIRHTTNGGTHKPERLQDNIDSGYAVWTTWQEIARNGPHFVKEQVSLAKARSTRLIKNDRPRMLRNGTPPWKTNPNPLAFLL